MPDDIMNSVAQNKGIINAKKFYAINELKDRFRYLIIFDAEAKIIKSANLLEICEKYFANKVLYGNSTYGDMTDMQQACLSHFTHNEKTDENIKLYLWFNQLCIYDSETIDDFFNKTNILHDINKLTILDFDYYIYMYYLIFYHKFKIEDIGIKMPCGFAEDCSGVFEKEDTNNRNIKKFKFYMGTDIMPKVFNKHVFVLIHLDRKKAKKRTKLYKFLHFYWLRGKK